MSTQASGGNTTRKWLRLATSLAVVGVLTAGAGGVVLVSGETASATPGNGQEKIGVCHRTASESNPYVYLEVPAAEANGHITGTGSQHHQQVTWKSEGSWRGVAHAAGDLRLDYYAHEDEIAARQCLDTSTPTEDPTTPPTEDPTTPPTEEPTEDPTTPPTEEPTDEPTDPGTEPSDEPSQPSDDVTHDPSNESRDDTDGQEQAPDQDADDATASPSTEAVPRRIDAGVTTDASTLWGAGLVGGGSALVLSSGGIVVGARRFEDR
ncbi:hypothetical protein IDH50_06145 [Aeromicrobium tamlense]|uniref:Uncharacterized protein n=1 Tax=Aeromicrobium tamlense TaxID=375541 RepID=A0A8I0FVW4_9ACTN|nr:hypothetical protein [Aeromicrobium tamlense]MBD1269800.1 hypothetical protein [Aeromicrobium tamlense]NYI39543.1 hypothetical protein [Aeromicrobium tamlense]